MKWRPEDQVTMFDLIPNSVDSKTKETEVSSAEVEKEDGSEICIATDKL